METFHLLHLAASWRDRERLPQAAVPPLTTTAVTPTTSHVPSTQPPPPSLKPAKDDTLGPRIRAAAVHMVFANRTSQDFITPAQVAELEAWSGRGVLDALRGFEIPSEVRAPLSTR